MSLIVRLGLLVLLWVLAIVGINFVATEVWQMLTILGMQVILSLAVVYGGRSER